MFLFIYFASFSLFYKLEPKNKPKANNCALLFFFVFAGTILCFVFADMTEEGSAQKRMLGMLLAFSLWFLGKF